MNIPEEWRHRAALAMAHTSWWSALLLTAWITAGGGADGNPRRVWSLAVILLIGIAISTGLALGRMRLTHAIISTFQVGMRATNHNTEIAAKRAAESAAVEAVTAELQEVARVAVEQIRANVTQELEQVTQQAVEEVIATVSRELREISNEAVQEVQTGVTLEVQQSARDAVEELRNETRWLADELRD